MTAKEIIKKISLNTFVPEKTIDIIISHQFSSALKAFEDNNSVEISGIGKFLFHVPKAHKLLEKYERLVVFYNNIINDESLSETKRRNASIKLNNMLGTMDSLKTKLKV